MNGSVNDCPCTVDPTLVCLTQTLVDSVHSDYL